MAGIFQSGRVNSDQGPATGLRLQSSLQGRPRNIGAGQNRSAGSLIWYGDFKAVAQSSTGALGGKGAGGSGKGQSGTYTYSASFIVSLGESVSAIQTVFNGNQIDFWATPPSSVLADLAALGITPTYGNTYGATFLGGDYAQTPWSYLVSAHPSQALAYRGGALMCFANLGLDTSPTLPNFSFEVLWPINSDIPALGPDANPADWVNAFLTNADWGVGFPAALMGDLTAYQTWARATGMLVSPVLTSQTAANSHLADIMKGTIADFRWSSGLLTVVPLGDQAVTGNGYTYSPALTPIYDLDVALGDFLPNQGSLGTGTGRSPIVVKRKDPATILNRVQVEYLDRSNLYNPVTIYNSDDASIVAANRLRLSDLRAHHFFCQASAASMSAALQMHREKVVVQYQFTTSAKFILPDTLDVLTLTEPNLGLVKQAVRITAIDENADGTLTFTAEEFLGTVTAPLYARQAPLGNGRNINVAPGSVNAPLLFEPTDELAGGLEIWAGVSGQNLALWGGCNVWVAYDSGGTYSKVGTISGAARVGVSTADLPPVTPAGAGQTVDNTNTLAVDLSASGGALATGSFNDMIGLNTASYIGGEIIAYQTASLTGANQYGLAPMVRGAYGTSIADHPAGSAFARLDDAIFKLPFTQDRIGTTIYIKLQSFNIYGGGLEDLSTLGAYPYVIKGTALASPLPDVQNLRSTYVDKTAGITWDDVTDFRPVRYEVRVGDTWDTGLSLGTVAHPPFPTYGDGHYMLKATSQPTSGLIVYSQNAAAITIAGSILVSNVVATYDEAATGWTGTVTGAGAISGGDFVTTATNAVAYYEVPAAHVFDVNYSRATRLSTSWKAVGIPVNQNVLTMTDFLNNPDILGSTASQFVDSWVEVAIAQAGSTDVFAATDVFAPADIFSGSVTYGPWTKFAPGQYVGEFFKMRVALITNDASTQGAVIAFTNTADVPDRVDHIVGASLPSGGTTFTFTPDGSATPVPFKGGPGGAALPFVSVAIHGATSGDTVHIDPAAFTAAQVKVQVLNGGAGVARTVDITVQGW